MKVRSVEWLGAREPFHRLFETLFGQNRGEDVATRTWAPPVDVRETEDAFIVTAELPGLSREDIQITLENDILRVSGERKFERDEKPENYHRIERSYGAFTRAFPLPSQVDAERVQAAFESGVLTITVPKAVNRVAEDRPPEASYALPASGEAIVAEPAAVEARELVRQTERSQRAQMEALIESLLPATTVPSAAAVLQARRNAEAREALLHEFGALTSSEVAEMAGSEAKNRAALANRWKQEGRIFSVTRHGVTLFPGFQFDEQGRPKPVIAEVVRALGSESSDWELALWFVSRTGWLGGRRPVDLLELEPQVVIEAAEREAAGFVS